MDMVSILYFFAKVVAYLVVCVVLICVGKDLLSYFRLAHYKKQGIKCFYWPLIGITSQFIPEEKDRDAIGKIRRFIETVQDQPLVMFNHHRSSTASGFLLDSKLVNELMALYKDGYWKREEIISKLKIGFFFEHGPQVDASRNLFIRFFNFNNLKSMTATINEVVDSYFADYAKKNLKSPEDVVKVKVRDFLSVAFEKIVNLILFDQEKEPMLDGVNLTTRINMNFNEVGKILARPAHILSLGLLHDYGLLSQTREYEKELARIENACYDIFSERKKKGKTSKPNILDLIVEANQERIDKGEPEMSVKEVSGHFMGFQLASVDTSQVITIYSVMHLGKDQEEQKKLYQIVSDMYKNKKSEGDQMAYEDIDNQLLEQYIDEFIRLGVPAPVLVPNLILKDMKLGKFSFKKGDNLVIPLLLLHQLSGKWENPMKFDPKRWAPENKSKIDRNSYIPFGKGPRSCIGKELGKLTVTIMLINMIKHFKIEKDETYIPLMVQELNYSYDREASVNLRRRQNIDTSS